MQFKFDARSQMTDPFDATVRPQLIEDGDYGRIGTTFIHRCIDQFNNEVVKFIGEMTVDADGCPSAYHPSGSPPGLDYLANAGKPGNWWGLATNQRGTPFVQKSTDPCPGFYVSTTALKHRAYQNGDPRREVDSLVVPYIVCPSPLISRVRGVVLGCKAYVRNILTDKLVWGVVADVGPRRHAGEASMAMAIEHGLRPSPKRGGSEKHIWEYVFFPGIAAEGFQLQPS